MRFSGMCFRLHEGTIAKEQVVEFLKGLLAHFVRPLLHGRGNHAQSGCGAECGIRLLAEGQVLKREFTCSVAISSRIFRTSIDKHTRPLGNAGRFSPSGQC